MKKLILLFLALGSLATGCNAESGSSTKQSNSSATTTIAPVTSNADSSTTLDLQAKCSKQAQEALLEFQQSLTPSPDGLQDSTSQTNHYNKAFDKCYVLIEDYPHISGQVQPSTNELYEYLEDAYGGNTLASCTYYDKAFGYDFWGDGSHAMCSIDNDSQGVSYKQYTDYVDQYMELNGN